MTPEPSETLKDYRTVRETKGHPLDSQAIKDIREFKASKPVEFQRQLMMLEREHERTLQHWRKSQQIVKTKDVKSKEDKDVGTEKALALCEQLLRETKAKVEGMNL